MDVWSHWTTVSVRFVWRAPCSVTPKPIRTSEDPKQMLRFDLENEGETIRNYRERIRQCEELGECAMAEQIRQILVNEQDHQIDLATALGEEVPDVSGPTGRVGHRQGLSQRRGSRASEELRGAWPHSGETTKRATQLVEQSRRTTGGLLEPAEGARRLRQELSGILQIAL